MKQTSVHAQLLPEKKKLLPVNFTFRYIDDVLSLNVSKFCDYFDRIYHIELEIINTIDTANSASYIDLDLTLRGFSKKPKRS